MRMKVLLTGANGFLGKCVALELSKHHIELITTTRKKLLDSYACNLDSEDEVVALFEKFNPDLVIHCAAFVPKNTQEYNNELLLSNNKKMLENILKATSVPMIFISSMTVYGPSEKVIRHEEDAGEPQTLYGVGKYESELLLKNDGRNSLSIRIPGLFGYQRKDGLVFNTIRNLCAGEKLNLPENIILWSAMDVKDAAKIIAELAVRLELTGYTPINVGYSEVHSIDNFLRTCEEIFEQKIECKLNHPKFQFDLQFLNSFNISSSGSIKLALLSLKNEYEFNNN